MSEYRDPYREHNDRGGLDLLVWAIVLPLLRFLFEVCT